LKQLLPEPNALFPGPKEFVPDLKELLLGLHALMH
jgi:hypothetical protein